MTNLLKTPTAKGKLTNLASTNFVIMMIKHKQPRENLTNLAAISFIITQTTNYQHSALIKIE